LLVRQWPGFDQGLTSMKRLPVFLLLGPVFGVLVALSNAVVESGRFPPPDYAEGCTMFFVFSLIVSVVAGPVDAILSYAVPISLRAPLTAIVGAAVAVGLDLYGATWTPPLHTLVLYAVLGALSMGACSLLSHDYRR
jgi:hypothetical protein